MGNMKKVYPKKPDLMATGPKYGTPENPKMTERERSVIQANFAEIFLFGPTDNDPYTLLAERIGEGTTRQRAKQLYWVFIHQQQGYFFKYHHYVMKCRGKLAQRIKGYTEFLDNPETIYQIIARADDEVEEAEAKKAAWLEARKQGNVKC